MHEPETSAIIRIIDKTLQVMLRVLRMLSRGFVGVMARTPQDGMTKRATYLPRFKVKTKEWEGQSGGPYTDNTATTKTKDKPKDSKTVPGLSVSLMGSHIENLGFFCDFRRDNVPDDANFTVDTVQRNIERLQADCTRLGKPFPTVLYLQLDNVNSNKSVLMFQYLQWLVLRGVFDKIKVCYLLVGHTHEYIDQFFSRYVLQLGVTKSPARRRAVRGFGCTSSRKSYTIYRYTLYIFTFPTLSLQWLLPVGASHVQSE
jgi:hypothetical protein